MSRGYHQAVCQLKIENRIKYLSDSRAEQGRSRTGDVSLYFSPVTSRSTHGRMGSYAYAPWLVGLCTK